MKTETLIELQRSITQGEWEAVTGCDVEIYAGFRIATLCGGELTRDKTNAEAIALVPELIAEVIRLREALRAMLAVQSELPPPMSDNAGYTDYCLRIVAAEDKASAALANDK